ncbi:hypothetical protein LEN26_008218 [Aphanomyces euteiches]|nr:hypothetical protein AeMF1_004825 [Aphanomyces euteiches]KAH9130757.1 hypothetical protein LEN26_008218 [Aphanomyces euteiches]KAH9189435.1 hypothetical protein AeNC1_008595 [Aphanomyces euteiches]
MVRVFALSALAAIAAASKFTNHFDINKLIQQNTEAVTAGVPEEWFEQQKLDHTDKTNNQVWKQRFFTNDEFYGGDGFPVFVYINGENVAANTTVKSTNLFMNVLAKKHKALIVSLEHRFYGKSQPKGDFTVESLKYLTAEQALNDLAYFQDHLTAKRKLVNAKWVAFGGSYPGMLAAWAKYKFNDRFVGSVASSGPIDAQVDFYQYADKVEFGLRSVGGEACTNAVKESLQALDALVGSTKAEDVTKLQSVFPTCTPIATDDERMVLESYIYFPFEGVAQSNDYATYTLKNVCEDFTVAGKTPLEKITAWNKKQYGDAKCYDINFDNNWLDSSVTSTAVDTVGINRQWTWQTCNEFGFGQNSASSKGIFGNLKYVTAERSLLKVCKGAYNVTDVEARVQAIRKMYGALKIDVPNVIFPTGTYDGWAALAPSNATGVVNPTSEVVDIDGTSHCGDMRAPTATDSGPLVWAHQRVEAGVDRFLRDKC